MDIYERINNLIRKLERSKYKTVSNQAVLKEIEDASRLYLDLACISAENKEIGNKLWDISQKYRQSKKEILKTLKNIKRNLSQYETRQKLGNANLKPGRVIIFTAKQNYSAYDQLKNFLSSSKYGVDIIDPYLYPETFNILKNVDIELKIRLLTNSGGFYRNSKIDFDNFKKEYKIEARNSDIIHDRFFIIDGAGYFSGSSLHNVGNKLSAIAIMDKNDTDVLQKEFNKIWNQSKKIQ